MRKVLRYTFWFGSVDPWLEEVIDAYDKNGFEANQDLPGNMLWEELYKSSPKGTKVILTVRSSDEGKD